MTRILILHDEEGNIHAAAIQGPGLHGRLGLTMKRELKTTEVNTDIVENEHDHEALRRLKKDFYLEEGARLVRKG